MHPIIPLFILFVALAGAVFIGLIVFNIVTDIANKTSKQMENQHISVSKDGMKISMKEVNEEKYIQQTQDMLVKAWNLSTWPAYKSLFWNKGATTKQDATAAKGGKTVPPESSKKTR